jgi:CHAD domain-containing protein
MAGEGAQYVLPDELDLAAASDELAARLDVQVGPARMLERTFYDTFDGRLRGAGVVLVHEQERLALVEGAGYAELAAADHPEPPERLLASDLPAGRLRDLLGPIVDVRALIPIAWVRSRARRLKVLNEDAKTVVRLAVEEPTVAANDRSRGRLHDRIVVSPVRGYDDALDRVQHTLEHEIGLNAAKALLQDEAVVAAGGTPGGVHSKPRPALRADQRADSAAVEVLSHLLAVIEGNLPGTLADVDTEFLHDLRVAVRRSRSVQRQLRGVFPPEPLERFRAEFRRLQQITGPSRDLDVYLLELDGFLSALPGSSAHDLEPVRRLLVERRRGEHRRMASELRSPRTRELLDDWSAFLDGLVELPLEDRPDAARAVADLAGERIHKVYRRMVKTGRKLDAESPPEALHDLRKKGKELRYLLEFFGGLYGDEVAKPMVKTLKSLQSTLGRFQDREVQAETLRSLREDVAGLDDGAAALMAMGLLVEHLEQGQEAARSEFAERFAAFAAKPQRKLVRRAFG